MHQLEKLFTFYIRTFPSHIYIYIYKEKLDKAEINIYVNQIEYPYFFMIRTMICN